MTILRVLFLSGWIETVDIEQFAFSSGKVEILASTNYVTRYIIIFWKLGIGKDY
jgi:hypothetical protein